jgi:hypothetical protein
MSNLNHHQSLEQQAITGYQFYNHDHDYQSLATDWEATSLADVAQSLTASESTA